VSIWNFVIYTSDHQQYLYALKNLSEERHTGEFLCQQIEQILVEIGPDKFSAIVTDGAANVNLARLLITDKFKHILNLRCIAHCINLISKDIIKHKFANNLIVNCNTVVKFFKQSHQANDILQKTIKNNEIIGGGLKSYCKTRWTSMYDLTESVLRLKPCFDIVSYYINICLT
jgi:Protein of unknown function (DUF 659)